MTWGLQGCYGSLAENAAGSGSCNALVPQAAHYVIPWRKTEQRAQEMRSGRLRDVNKMCFHFLVQ